METVEVKVYYLEMLKPPVAPVVRAAAPRAGLSVVHAQAPTVAFYRFLYHTVGGPYNWLSRRKLSDSQLAAVLANPLNEVHVLYVDGTPAGYAELDRRQPQDIELVQFGLMPEFIGKGLGKWLLEWTIAKAWSYEPKRFWLHTCSLDHPVALPNYQKAGFSLYRKEVIQREL